MKFLTGRHFKEHSFKSWFTDEVINKYSIDGRGGRVKVKDSKILQILKSMFNTCSPI